MRAEVEETDVVADEARHFRQAHEAWGRHPWPAREHERKRADRRITEATVGLCGHSEASGEESPLGPIAPELAKNDLHCPLYVYTRTVDTIVMV
jgi:hypothetical protein